MEMQLDWAYEDCEVTVIQMASYHQRAIAQYKKIVWARLFCLGDLVMRQVFENMTEIRVEKLQPNWEDPYVVIKVRNLEAYHMQTMDNTSLLRPQNVANLKKKYYQ